MWFTIVSIIYVLVCAFLILVVLLQQGKGGGMGSAFGGSTQTVFGGAGAGNFLTRLTAIAATLFMVLSALLAYMSSSGDRSLRAAEQIEQEREEDSVSAGGEGEAEVEAPPAPSEDTPSQAEQDEALNALERELGVGGPEGEADGEEPVPAEGEAAPAEGEEPAPAEADGAPAEAGEPAAVEEPAAAAEEVAAPPPPRPRPARTARPATPEQAPAEAPPAEAPGAAPPAEAPGAAPPAEAPAE